MSSIFEDGLANLSEGSFVVRRRDALILLLLAFLAATMLFWRLGEGSLGDYDEADYAQSAREMLWWNDWNTPRWNGMEFFDKPPLCMWLTAIAYKFFGINEFGARFVSASAGLLVVLVVYVLGLDLFGRRSIGLGAAIMLLTVSPNLASHGYNFVSLARVGQLDMMLILMMTLTVWLAWRGQRDPKCLLLLGLPLGLGLMVKSVAGLMAYGIVALFLLTSSWHSRIMLRSRPWWRKEMLGGMLLSGLVALPWHVGQLLIWGRQFWNSYMVSLTVGYVTGDQGHTRDMLFYLRSIQRGFPVLYPLVALAVLYAIYRVLRYRDQAILLLLCWTVVPFALYNISRSKIGWYMVPVYPALALLTMRLLDSAVDRWRNFSSSRSGSAVSSTLGRALPVLVVLLANLAFNPWLPRAKDFNPGVKAVASYSRYVLAENDVLVNYWPGSYWIRPSALFYADRPVLLVTEEEALRRLLARGGCFYIMTDWVYWEPLQELGSVTYRSGGYVLARAHGPALGCLRAGNP